MNKILVINRGEIALRIMQTCKDMGIQTVAIYSEADRNAPFVRFANEAICIGPPPSNQSYLLEDKIIEVAKQLNVDGVHPGYGFLSENANFANKLKNTKITLIGPSPHAMEIMGSKLAAKKAVKSYNIPLIPGTDEAIDDVEEAKKTAIKIGYPILIKASAGGGGKGMRVAQNESEFEEQLNRAISEAKSAFGDGSVFIEKYITSPRHIEIQIMADLHGNIIYLFERDCSIQRRHQKVIEEAPSSVLTPELRKQMGECAVNVAKACDYVGAGTVEFIFNENNEFYFLEMNTRLQVEHPVTELITGLDLVRMQIEVARGKALDIKQEDLKIKGHAFEVRVYAEDPTNNFLPDIGKLKTYKIPSGPGVRVDNGFEEGMRVPIYYDSMLSKLISYGKNREEARKRMLRAIEEYKISGVKTTLDFCRFAINHQAFIDGKFDTNFIKLYFTPEKLNQYNEDEEIVASILAHELFSEKSNIRADVKSMQSKKTSNWKKNRLYK